MNSNHAPAPEQLSTPTRTEFGPGEKFLIRVFERYLREIFDHGDAVADATLTDLIVLHAFDKVEAAGLIVENEFGHELAGDLCRRACFIRHLAPELSQLLCVQSYEELEELQTVQSMRFRQELEEKHGALFVPAAALAEVPS